MENKGYVTAYGYKGWVKKENKYMLFATEEEYIEYTKESEEAE